MTGAAGERLIARELGPGVLRAAKEGRARDVLVLLLTDHEDLMRTPEGALFALGLAVRIRAGSSDSYLPSGRIGRLDLKGGCYTAYTVFRLVAEDLARRGLARTVSAHLRAGRQTVRDFLTERYGVSIGPRQYFTPRGRTPDQADVTDFLRMLTNASRASCNTRQVRR
jgi:hypothetical protein